MGAGRGDREPVLGKQSGGAGEGGQLPGQADQPERRGQAPLPHGPAIKGRIPPARLPARSPTSGKCTSHLGFGLVRHSPVVVEPHKSPAHWRLSDAGLAKAKELALRPQWESLTRLIASSELKAIETAVCIANTTGLPIGISPEIDEVHRPAFVPDYEQLVRQFFNSQVPVDWESITEAQGRVQRFVASLARDATHEHVALVGHGLLWALARSWLLGQTRPNMEEWKAIAMPDFSSWNITDSGVVITSEFQGIKEMG